MLISESQVKQIIKEEIEKMIAEGEIEEGWLSDKISGLGKSAAGRFAKAAGLSSAELANQEKAAATQKVASQEKAVAAQKESAKKKVVEKLQSIINTISKIETTDFDQIYDLAEPLRYASGKKIDVASLRDIADLLLGELEGIIGDIQGREHKGKLVNSLSEKKAAQK